MLDILGNVLWNIEQLEYQLGFGGSLYVPSGENTYTSQTPCAILFMSRAEDEMPDFEHPFAKEHSLWSIASVYMAQEIVGAARNVKPDCTQDDLVKAFEYYLDNDAFYPFDEELP